MRLSRNFSLNSKLCFQSNKRGKQVIHSDWWTAAVQTFYIVQALIEVNTSVDSRTKEKDRKILSSLFLTEERILN